jgi:hypothetical protein|tara:strand:- start:552 stop:767 length:216 start_codon:yes stop_codon:yes gene_type:complete
MYGVEFAGMFMYIFSQIMVSEKVAALKKVMFSFVIIEKPNYELSLCPQSFLILAQKSIESKFCEFFTVLIK